MLMQVFELGLAAHRLGLSYFQCLARRLYRRHRAGRGLLGLPDRRFGLSVQPNLFSLQIGEPLLEDTAVCPSRTRRLRERRVLAHGAELPVRETLVHHQRDMPRIYFLVMHDPADPSRDFGLVKVGITDQDVAQRVSELQTGNPFELRCAGTIETSHARQVEHFIHRAHAARMQHREWLRWPRMELEVLFETAREAARRIEDRKAKEQLLAKVESNGCERRPDRKERGLHREIRDTMRRLVPAEIRLETVTKRLYAAAGRARGIEGVLRATRAEATRSFREELALDRFPRLVDAHRITKIRRTFRWRNVPTKAKFPEERVANEEASGVLASLETAGASELAGWKDRSPEIEALHHEYLQLVESVERLQADRDELESEFVLRLGVDEAIEGVCSHTRKCTLSLDRSAFEEAHPCEAAECYVEIPARIRRHIYRARAYL